MHSTNLRLALGCLFGLSAAASYGQQSSPATPTGQAPPVQPAWGNALIMPRSINLQLRIDGAAPPPPPGRTVTFRGNTGDLYDIEWPAKVMRVEGQWLWIEDQSGYNVPPRCGWVSTEEVLRLDDPSNLHDAYTFYTDAVKKQDAAWLHWLLGICLEKKEQVQAAKEEYLAALKNSGRSDLLYMQLSLSGTDVTGTAKAFRGLAAMGALKGSFHDELNSRYVNPSLVDECQEALKVVRGTSEVAWQPQRETEPKPEFDTRIRDAIAAAWSKDNDVLMFSGSFSGRPDEDADLLEDNEQELRMAAPLKPLLDNLANRAVYGVAPSCEPYLADAKLRLERLRAREAKSSAAAAYSAVQIYLLLPPNAKPPHVYYEVAKAFARAYGNRVEESTHDVDHEGELLDRLEEYRQNLKDDIAAVKPPNGKGARAGHGKNASVAKEKTKYLAELAQVGEDLTKINYVLTKLNDSMSKHNALATIISHFCNGLEFADFVRICQEPKVADYVTLWAGSVVIKGKLIIFNRTWVDAAINDLETRIEDFERDLTTAADPGKDATAKLSEIEKALQVIDERLLDPMPVLSPENKVTSCLDNIQKYVLRVETLLDLYWSDRRLKRPQSILLPSDSDIADEEQYFDLADEFYDLSVRPAVGDPKWYLAYRSRAELQMTKILDYRDDSRGMTALINEAQDLVQEAGELGKTIVSRGKDSSQQRSSSGKALDVRITADQFDSLKRGIANRARPVGGKAPAQDGGSSADAFASLLQFQVQVLEDTAGSLAAKTAPACQRALGLLNDAVRQKPDLGILYYDRASVYFFLLDLDSNFGHYQSSLDTVIQGLQGADGKVQELAKKKTRIDGAVARITDDFIDGKEEWPWPEKPANVTRDLRNFWKTERAQKPDDKDAKKKLQDLLSRFHDTQQALGEIKDMNAYLGSARKAYDMARVADDGSDDVVYAAISLATAYSCVGDFRSAEYFENRALAHAQARPSWSGRCGNLAEQREKYRDKIPPDDTNPSWRDAPHNLPDGLPAISSK